MNTKQLESVFRRFCESCPAPYGRHWSIQKTRGTGRYLYYLATQDDAGVVQPAIPQLFYLSEMAAFLEGMIAYREMFGTPTKRK